MAEAVIARPEWAGKRALAFEISEDVPLNWPEAVQVLLETLEYLR